jgi:hypothetical protein
MAVTENTAAGTETGCTVRLAKPHAVLKRDRAAAGPLPWSLPSTVPFMPLIEFEDRSEEMKVHFGTHSPNRYLINTRHTWCWTSRLTLVQDNLSQSPGERSIPRPGRPLPEACATLDACHYLPVLKWRPTKRENDRGFEYVVAATPNCPLGSQGSQLALVLVVDTSASMNRYLASVAEMVGGLLQQLGDPGGSPPRIGLVAFQDDPKTPRSRARFITRQVLSFHDGATSDCLVASIRALVGETSNTAEIAEDAFAGLEAAVTEVNANWPVLPTWHLLLVTDASARSGAQSRTGKDADQIEQLLSDHGIRLHVVHVGPAGSADHRIGREQYQELTGKTGGTYHNTVTLSQLADALAHSVSPSSSTEYSDSKWYTAGEIEKRLGHGIHPEVVLSTAELQDLAERLDRFITILERNSVASPSPFCQPHPTPLLDDCTGSQYGRIDIAQLRPDYLPIDQWPFNGGLSELPEDWMQINNRPAIIQALKEKLDRYRVLLRDQKAPIAFRCHDDDAPWYTLSTQELPSWF